MPTEADFQKELYDEPLETYDKSLEMEHAANLDEGELITILMDSVAECADGCIVEPDGRCQHGYRSPLLVLGMI